MSVKETRKERYAYLAWMLLALLTAVSLRLIALSTVPPGLTHDEADHGLTAWSIVNGARALYFSIGYGREPLYDYATAVLMRFLGPTYLAGRVTAVYFSLILIAGMAAWVRRAFDWQTGVLTAAGLAVSFWPVMTARQSLRSITLPALFTLALYLFWRSLETHRLRLNTDAFRSKSASIDVHPHPIFFFASAGIVLGLTFYTYIPARLLWAVFPATLIYLGWQNRRLFRQTWRGTLLMLLLAALIGAPLFVYLASHPDAETRIGQLSQPLTAVTQGNLAPLWQNTRAGLGILAFQGDGYWRYNIPGQPLLPPLLGVLFFAGLLLAVWWIVTGRRQTGLQPTAAFLALAWLLAGLAPVLVTGSRLSTTQAIGMQPVVYLFPALALRQLAGSLQNTVSGSRLAAYAVRILLLLLFSGTAVTTAINYFSVWANQPDVRVEYESTMVAAMQAIHTGDLGNTAVSTQTPRPYHTPALATLTLPPDLPAPRWFDARTSLILPSAPQSFMLIPGFTPLNPALETYFATAVLSQTLPLRPTDLDRPLAIYRLDGAQMAADWAQKFQTLAGGAVNFGDTAVFLGYDLQTPTAVAGDVITIAMWWQAKRPLADAVLFTQVMGSDGRPIAQADRLDVPGEGWQAGDQFIQLHQFTLPEATAVGQYPIIIGLYTCPAGCPQTQAPQRLPILSPAGLPADYLPLTELSVTTP
ncbi:MAG: hypothetical protein KBE23_24845 [Chloroflexi bacterium]|nr:hypothetical protein [Chloroflexota bacterium]MBP7045995.1 hypothetical protein [Chloroflexota bacterium]